MAEENPSPPVSVSRDELYRQVWEIPMTRLAAQYGISGNGLAKICKRLQIPIPGRGFWAKKASGQEVVQERLADANADTPREVTITPTPAPVNRLVEIAHQWQDAETVRRFLASLTARPSAHDAQIGQDSLAEWLEWANERITRSDPLLSGPEGVFQEVSKVEPWTYRDVNTNVYFDDDGQ